MASSKSDFDCVETIKGWTDLIRFEKRYTKPNKEWVFRGDSEVRPLKTTLERTWENFPKIEVKDLRGLEKRLERDFRRQYQMYSPAIRPKEDDYLLWLSLMRHYGTPTRLLDFTYSFFIAAFFALVERPREDAVPKKSAKAQKSEEPAVVWLVDKSWLTYHSIIVMDKIRKEKSEWADGKLWTAWQKRKGRAFKTIFWDAYPPIKTVFPVNPLNKHERLYVQQGLFLCPGSLTDGSGPLGFEGNLKHMEGSKKAVLKIHIDPKCKTEVLRRLGRAGINLASLFPGLEGFARSLGTQTPITFIELNKMQAKGARPRVDEIHWEKACENAQKQLGSYA